MLQNRKEICKVTPKQNFCDIIQQLLISIPISEILTWRRNQPWSRRRFPLREICSLHLGQVDLCEILKCGILGCLIYVSGVCVCAATLLEFSLRMLNQWDYKCKKYIFHHYRQFNCCNNFNNSNNNDPDCPWSNLEAGLSQSSLTL